MSLVSLGKTVFFEFCQQAQISKTLTPGDLENEDATNQTREKEGMLQISPGHELGRPRHNGFV